VAERVLSVLAEPFELRTPKAVSLTVRASIGIATGMRTSAEELIRDADVALHQAKEMGKARYLMFRPEMQAAIRSRLDLEVELHRGLEDHELFVLYQPIFDLTTLATKGVEALVRWQHPTRGVISPKDFIPIAEQSGLILPVGQFVLDEACRQTVGWRDAGYSIGVSVNVSAPQLESAGFVEDVGAALRESHLSPAALTLEVTESLLMRDTDRTASVLGQLKSLGVRVAIDDFGTGYSSLAYLRHFPIDALKIDRSFIATASRAPQSRAVVRALVQLGKALGIETVAEGIDDEAQLTRLQREQCDSGQGFLFAPPLHADVLLAFLSSTADRDPP
jgi:EAL domain-containing protein (putative c-di-GMP-specific phosphodiesterase class I)